MKTYFCQYMENDVSWSWLLFGGYIGAGVLCLTAACVASIVLKRRIRRKNKSFEIEMNNMAGKLVNPRGRFKCRIRLYVLRTILNKHNEMKQIPRCMINFPKPMILLIYYLVRFRFVRSSRPKRTGSSQFKWKGPRRARTFFPH